MPKALEGLQGQGESPKACGPASSGEASGDEGKPGGIAGPSPEQLAHIARLTRHSVEMLENRVEAIEQHKLAPPPETKSAKPLKSLLRNLWVLAIMGGVVGIICAAKSRIHAPEPLAGVHATNGALPFVMPLDSTSVDYLFVNLLIAPYHPHDDGNGSTADGHRRRLLAAWVGEAVSLRDSADPAGVQGAPSSVEMLAAAGGQAELVAAQAHADLVRRMRQLLSKPKLVVAQRQRAPLRQHRRLLVDPALDEPPSDGSSEAALPELQVTIVQRNESAVAGSAAGEGSPALPAFFPVSTSQYCTTKDGAAVKCSMSFESGDMTNALVPGQPLYLSFEASQLTQLVFKVEASELGGLGPVKNWLALGILLVVLVGIASERIHRMWCAMLGAAFMVGLVMSLLLWMNMTPSLALVVEWLDESTLGLLFGMMIIVGRLQETGMFELFSAYAVKWSKGRQWALSLMLMVFTAFLSAWLDNVTTMLLMIPITISLMRTLNQDPVPLMLAQALMSNIGGAATMVGDPPALIIGTALSAYVGFVDFIINMAPGVLMAAAACIPLLLWMYRSALMGAIKRYDAVLAEVQGFRIKDWDLFAKCAFVTGAVLIGFLLHPVHHVDPAWFAVLGAVVLCVCDRPMEVEKVVQTVEWDMLLFFSAMFIMIEAAAEIGMISMIGGWLESLIRSAPEGSRTIVAIQILLWVSAIISGLLDNIPYTITMVPVIEYLASAGLGLDLPTLAWALNFGACFGGNATLIGASANIVTATLAERAGEKITFMSWLKAGVPITIVSVAMADVWMILRFCL